MPEFPFAYEKIAPTTWVYFSSLLMLALFFKFNRFWSVRNLDLVLIILLAPGILLIDFGNRLESSAMENSARRQTVNADDSEGLSDKPPLTKNVGENIESTDATTADVAVRAQRYLRIGYYWLLSMCLVFLIRMLIDPLLKRRPMLAPNLNVGGMVFLMCSLMTFLYANILMSKLTADDLATARSTIRMLKRETAEEDETLELRKRGPGLPLFQLFPIIPTFSNGEGLLQTDADQDRNLARYSIAAKSLAIFSQSALVLGLILIGYYHFHDARLGVGIACIYLMLPYTAQYMGHLIHVLPGALLVWAILCFRRPGAAGAFIGLATGVAYYPLFLLPLWISFYWEKGTRRFIFGVLVAIVCCVLTLSLTSRDLEHFGHQLRATFGFWIPLMKGLEGIWGLGWDSWYRLPILVAFVALCISFVFWPTRKNTGTLIAYTCAIMVAVQFWHGFQGGLVMAWYLPAALITIFRPNTDGRDAKSELNQSRV